MTWGLKKYADAYVRNCHDPQNACIEPRDCLLDYDTAIGRGLPSLIQDVFNDTGNSSLFTLFPHNTSSN